MAVIAAHQLTHDSKARCCDRLARCRFSDSHGIRRIRLPVDERLLSNIPDLMRADAQRMKMLTAVASLNLPDCYIAAGFVRNLVWDHLHGFDQTPINDVDVIYFDGSQSLNPDRIQKQLSALLPDIHWQVKNQAVMHARNGDAPYLDSQHAMAHWPEKETAIAVRLVDVDKIEVCAPFGAQSLFMGHISHNQKRSLEIFDKRVASKHWLGTWPQLKVVY